MPSIPDTGIANIATLQFDKFVPASLGLTIPTKVDSSNIGIIEKALQDSTTVDNINRGIGGLPGLLGRLCALVRLTVTGVDGTLVMAEMVDLMIKYKVNINTTDVAGKTPLMEICTCITAGALIYPPATLKDSHINTKKAQLQILTSLITAKADQSITVLMSTNASWIHEAYTAMAGRWTQLAIANVPSGSTASVPNIPVSAEAQLQVVRARINQMAGTTPNKAEHLQYIDDAIAIITGTAAPSTPTTGTGTGTSTPTTGTGTGTSTPTTGTTRAPTSADLLEMQKAVYNKLTEVIDFSKIANLPTNFAITLPDGNKHTKGQITIQDLIYAIKRASVPLTANQDFGVDGYTGKDSANFIGFAEDILGGDVSQVLNFLSKICVPEEFTLLWGYQTITTAPSAISNTITPLQQSIFNYLVAKIGKTSMPNATRAEIAQGGPSGPVLSPAYKEFMSNHLLPDQFVLDIIKLGATQQQADDIINAIAEHGLWDGTPVSAMKVEDLGKYLNPGSATYTPSPALRTATPISPLAPGRYVEFLSNARTALMSIYQDIYSGHLLTKPEDVAITLSNITIRIIP